MRYLLDANIFIQAKNLHYGFDFCPAFWEWLLQQNGDGNVASIDKVGGELQGVEDEFSTWAAARGASFFMPPDDQIPPALTRVSIWATGQSYEPAAVATFLQVADYWLVAHALAHSFVVVTHEVPSESVRKIKIPNACIGLGLPCVSPYEMLRRERARFVLGGGPGQP
ncbi:MAG: DUF4411 family protein [Rhodospirillales bacterium]|nr:DUF4411 family protein [Rhodospirillales bacterium]